MTNKIQCKEKKELWARTNAYNHKGDETIRAKRKSSTGDLWTATDDKRDNNYYTRIHTSKYYQHAVILRLSLSSFRNVSRQRGSSCCTLSVGKHINNMMSYHTAAKIDLQQQLLTAVLIVSGEVWVIFTATHVRYDIYACDVCVGFLFFTVMYQVEYCMSSSLQKKLGPALSGDWDCLRNTSTWGEFMSFKFQDGCFRSLKSTRNKRNRNRRKQHSWRSTNISLDPPTNQPNY